MEEEALPANFSQLEEKEEEEDDPEEPRRHHHHHFVLVHGVGHGGWCWYKVRSLLQGAGHKVSCVDLASAGIDRADPNLVRSIEEYDAPLFHLLSALPDHHKVVLVGHSAGGLSVTHALHAFRSRIKLAIYLAATMLPWGFQTQEDVKDGVPNLSRFGDVYELSFNLGPRNPPTCVALKKKFHRPILYQMSSIQDSTLASMLLRPWPAALLNTKLSKADNLSGGTRRVYIKTEHDNMVSPEQQDAMIRRWPPDEVLLMDSDHSPFFSAPDGLCKLLLRASSSAC